MSNVAIDESTGLPVLEEGLVWKVEADRRGELEKISIVSPTESCEAVLREVRIPGVFFPNRIRIKSRVSHETVIRYPVVATANIREEHIFHSRSMGTTGRYGTPRPVLSEEDDEQVQKLREEGFFRDETNYGVVMWKPVEPTKENVLKAALIAYDRMIAMQERKRTQEERRKATEELVGLYPPKKLD